MLLIAIKSSRPQRVHTNTRAVVSFVRDAQRRPSREDKRLSWEPTPTHPSETWRTHACTNAQIDLRSDGKPARISSEKSFRLLPKPHSGRPFSSCTQICEKRAPANCAGLKRENWNTAP